MTTPTKMEEICVSVSQDHVNLTKWKIYENLDTEKIIKFLEEVLPKASKRCVSDVSFERW